MSDILRTGMLWIKQTLSSAIRIEFSDQSDYPAIKLEWRNAVGSSTMLAAMVAHLKTHSGRVHNHFKLDTGRREGAPVMGGDSGHYPVLDIDCMTGATDEVPENKRIPAVRWNNCYMYFRVVGEGSDADSALVFVHNDKAFRFDVDKLIEDGLLIEFTTLNGVPVTPHYLASRTEALSD